MRATDVLQAIGAILGGAAAFASGTALLVTTFYLLGA